MTKQLAFNFAVADHGRGGAAAALRQAAPVLAQMDPALLSKPEAALLEEVRRDDEGAARNVDQTGDADPWAQWLRAGRSTQQRRDLGQFFTPLPIVRVMVDWVARHAPQWVVDAGCGTGRFAVESAQRLPRAQVIAMDNDPAATLLCRARVQSLGLPNVAVRCDDFLRTDLRLGEGTAAFVGNPPYVRHHRLSPQAKRWAAAAGKKLGVRFSGLSGLHVYFFLATALHARPGDVGCLITSSEWLDVNYGQGLRRLLLDRLGLESVCVLAECEEAFSGVMTSAAITCFRVGRKPVDVRFSTVPRFTRADGPQGAPRVARSELDGRWGNLARSGSPPSREPCTRLGDLAAVHRGIATGANDYFVMSPVEAEQRGLAQFARPVISRGRRVIEADGEIDLRRLEQVIILLPRSLAGLRPAIETAVRRFLQEGEAAGIDHRYLCRHRRPWWWLGKDRPPPIVASYMARRPPAFARNPGRALILNIAHGLFPRRAMSAKQLRCLVAALNRSASGFVGNGRRYQGGLEKFEPKEMEDLRLPLSAVAGMDRASTQPEMRE